MARSPKKRTYNTRRIKRDLSYSVEELAELLDVHENSVRQWLKSGLTAIDDRRPTLVHGSDLIRFLTDRQSRRKRSCQADEFFCCRCRKPVHAWENLVDIEPVSLSRILLKDGINDGFLTPFKVRQIATTLDDYVYTSDDDVIEGEIEEGRRYVETDFNKVIEIRAREHYRVKLFMGMIDQAEKTLVFCATQDHALAVRDLINQMKTSRDPNYCVRVTANDGAEGERFLRTFQDNEKTIPTVLTTSQKLSTGVDARNIRNIVLMRPINSMIEFKQIIGRGTRLFDGKDHFTIYDFVKAYEHFNDAEWDGEPVELEPSILRPAPEPSPETPDDDGGGEEPPPRQKVKVKLADGKERLIQHMSATTFWSPDGKPMSAKEFIERLYGELPNLFRDEDQLRELWGQPGTRKALLESLAERGYGQEQLQEIGRMINAEKSDIYDVLAYIAYAASPVTREKRVATRRKQIIAPYDDSLQAFLDFVLMQYVQEGVGELDDAKLPDLLELKYHSLYDAAAKLGGVPHIREAFVGFQAGLYRSWPGEGTSRSPKTGPTP